VPVLTAYEQSGQTRPQVFAVRLRQHLRALLDEMAAEAGVPVDQQWEDEPYLGLRAFDLQHASIFFGREQETGAVLEALQQQQRNGCAFVLLVTLNEADAAQPVHRRVALEAVTGTPARKQLVEALTAARLLTSASYKGLSRVEQAFRNLKTVSLEMRPMDHKTDARIRAHVFLCMLAYSLADLSRRQCHSCAGHGG
jgi:hypothetical protein